MRKFFSSIFSSESDKSTTGEGNADMRYGSSRSSNTTNSSPFTGLGFDFSSLSLLKKERKFPYSYDGPDSSKVTLDINLDYQYTYDDIKTIWSARVNLLQRWMVTKIDAYSSTDQLIPVVLPEFEVNVLAVSGAQDSLSGYLQWESKERLAVVYEAKRKQEQEGSTDPIPSMARIILIPYNTGGHWIAFMLLVGPDNKLVSACHINSLNHAYDKVGQHYDDNVRKQFAYIKGGLPKEHRYSQEILAVYPEFDREIYSAVHYLQPYRKACGPLTIENAMAMAKRAYYTVYAKVLSETASADFCPHLCDDRDLTQIRGMHLQLIGGPAAKLYAIQRDNNNQERIDPYVQQLFMARMNSRTILAGEARIVMGFAVKLDQSALLAFIGLLLPEKGEEHGVHLTRIRTGLSGIYDRLALEEAQLLREEEEIRKLNPMREPLEENREGNVNGIDRHATEQYELRQQEWQMRLLMFQAKKIAVGEILQRFYGVSFEAFESAETFHNTFAAPFSEYEQLLAFGKALQAHCNNKMVENVFKLDRKDQEILFTVALPNHLEKADGHMYRVKEALTTVAINIRARMLERRSDREEQVAFINLLDSIFGQSMLEVLNIESEEGLLLIGVHDIVGGHGRLKQVMQTVSNHYIQLYLTSPVSTYPHQSFGGYPPRRSYGSSSPTQTQHYGATGRSFRGNQSSGLSWLGHSQNPFVSTPPSYSANPHILRPQPTRPQQQQHSPSHGTGGGKQQESKDPQYRH